MPSVATMMFSFTGFFNKLSSLLLAHMKFPYFCCKLEKWIMKCLNWFRILWKASRFTTDKLPLIYIGARKILIKWDRSWSRWLVALSPRVEKTKNEVDEVHDYIPPPPQTPPPRTRPRRLLFLHCSVMHFSMNPPSFLTTGRVPNFQEFSSFLSHSSRLSCLWYIACLSLLQRICKKVK